MSDTTSTPKVKKARKSKWTPEILDFAVEMRAKEGMGLVKLSKAIVEKFGVKQYPSELQAQLKRHTGVASIKDLARAQTTKATSATARTQPSPRETTRIRSTAKKTTSKK